MIDSRLVAKGDWVWWLREFHHSYRNSPLSKVSRVREMTSSKKKRKSGYSKGKDVPLPSNSTSVRDSQHEYGPIPWRYKDSKGGQPPLRKILEFGCWNSLHSRKEASMVTSRFRRWGAVILWRRPMTLKTDKHSFPGIMRERQHPKWDRSGIKSPLELARMGSYVS
jgi:hypothetical protein